MNVIHVIICKTLVSGLPHFHTTVTLTRDFHTSLPDKGQPVQNVCVRPIISTRHLSTNLDVELTDFWMKRNGPLCESDVCVEVKSTLYLHVTSNINNCVSICQINYI